MENDTYNPFVRKKCETAEDEEEKIKGGPSLKLGLSILTEPLGALEKYYTLGISISNWGTTIGLEDDGNRCPPLVKKSDTLEMKMTRMRKRSREKQNKLGWKTNIIQPRGRILKLQK